jgi:hypothetical protein
MSFPSAQPRRTRPALAAGGVLIVIVCAALGASVAGRSTGGVPYLEVTHAVPAGAPLEPADLGQVDLDPSSGLVGVPAEEETTVVGSRATAPLAPGTLLVTADVSAAPPVPRGDAVVGASLAPDQLPTEVQPGDSVLVVLTGPSGPTGGGGGQSPASGGRSVAGAVGPGQVLATGVVVDIAPPGSAAVSGSSSDATIVSLAVPGPVAPQVTAASAADQLSLALEGPPAATARGGRP